MRPLTIHELGRTSYSAALQMQLQARERVLAGGADEAFVLEHDPVVTLGRRGGIVDHGALQALGTPVVETSRGGLATWHGPGQLVIYPIVRLERAGTNVPSFVARLGAMMCQLARAAGVHSAEYDGARPGIYIEGRKLGSIGLHIHKGVTIHGLALNVDIDLRGFGAIIPCGMPELLVTSLARESGSPVGYSAVAREAVVLLRQGALFTDGLRS